MRYTFTAHPDGYFIIMDVTRPGPELLVSSHGHTNTPAMIGELLDAANRGCIKPVPEEHPDPEPSIGTLKDKLKDALHEAERVAKQECRNENIDAVSAIKYIMTDLKDDIDRLDRLRRRLAEDEERRRVGNTVMPF